MKRFLAVLITLVILCQSLVSCDILPSGFPWSSDGTSTSQKPNGSDTPTVCTQKSDHRDKDKNGVCDNCSYDVTVVLDLYAINDLHGKFDDDAESEQVGVDEMSTYLKGAASRDEHHLILASGDMWQGSAESNVTRGALITDWLGELGVVSMTLGNHEYDWGKEQILANAENASFPFLAINVYEKLTNQRVPYCAPSVMVERGDLTIGIIGAIGDCYSSISADQVGDVYFKTGSDLSSLVMAESEKLRAAGADFIVYSLHDGHDQNNATVIKDSDLNGYYDPRLSRDGYIDLVFEGHTHKRYALRDAYGVYHLQGGGDNKGLSHVEVEINFANDEWQVQDAEYVASYVYASFADDPIVDSLLEKYDDLIAPTRDLLGNVTQKRSSEEICDKAAELYLAFGETTWGAEYDIVLGGGFLQTRSPYDLETGEVYYKDLMSILPFDNRLVLCSIKGSDLERRFFNTTNGDYHIYLGAYGESVRSNLNPNGIYYVVVDTYTSQYAPNHLTVVKEYGEDLFARDLLARFLKENGGW